MKRWNLTSGGGGHDAAGRKDAEGGSEDERMEKTLVVDKFWL